MTEKKENRLGIDIDGTVTDPATFVPFLNEAFGKELTFEEITQYDLPPLYGITDEAFMEWFMKNEGLIYEQSSLAKHAREALESLANDHHLIYISARNGAHHQLTLDWFAKHQLPYDHIELLGSHDKVEISKRHRIELFFEDKLDNANDLAEELNIPILLFNTPYNTGPVHKHVCRVDHWQEALDKTRILL